MFSQLKRIKLSKIIQTAVSILIIGISIPFFTLAYNQITERLGLKLVPVPVVGTGSMYPSLYWDKSEGGPDDISDRVLEEYRSTPLMYAFVPAYELYNLKIDLRSIHRGDIVAFKNDKTSDILASEGKDKDSGFVKRVIAVPGDKVTISDGYVYLNNEILEEPYIYKPRSTYGGTFLADCQELVVPANKYFVLGDNRKLSDDSRFELGLIDESDVSFILPIDEQGIYKPYWRDASTDQELASTPSLDIIELYKLINEIRVEEGLTALTRSTALERSSLLRAESIIATNDFSIEATRSGYTMKKSMSDVGYSNILTGELISPGYYTEEELTKNLMYFNSTSSHILNPDYDEIGFSVVNQEINGCPAQAIVGHMGGYLPPAYDESMKDSWRSLVDNLNKVIPSWESARSLDYIDQAKLQELLNLLYERREFANIIYNKIENKIWLTSEDESNITLDQERAKRINQLIEELNTR